MNAIKWTGSKRTQAKEILKHFPREMDTYYEPFLGGGSIFKALAESNISVRKYALSDINADLMALYEVIRNSPEELCRHYETLWEELNRDNDLERKKRYYAEIRNRFNAERNPMDFLFIMRTTTNGTPRYNGKGEFNSSFHITRNGISPKRLQPVIHEWSKLLANVELKACSYLDISPGEKDFIYLDPPYANTKGMYYGAIDYPELWGWLSKVKCGWALSFDGISGETDNTQEVPPIYDEHLYVKSGNSSFRRVFGGNTNVMVYESLYVRNK